MVKVEIYVEGGGQTRALRQKCRQGFSEFFCKVGLGGRMPSVIASGSRQEAFKDFRTALRTAGERDFIALLVDSEALVKFDPWEHLKIWDKWDRPTDAADEQAHLMVQCMEAWFLSDRDKLAAYFGNSFNQNALPVRQDVENIAKSDVLNGLQNATRSCPKGKYDKGRHSFNILAQIDPLKVAAASPHARRLVNTLREKSGASG